MATTLVSVLSWIAVFSTIALNSLKVIENHLQEHCPVTVKAFYEQLRYLSKEKDLLGVPQAQVLKTYITQSQKEAEVHREKSWERLKVKGQWLSW